jgi:hypothetical protein
MTPLIEKYNYKEKVKSIAKERNFDEETYLEFIWFLDYNLEQEDRYGFEETDVDQDTSMLNYVNDYINEFIKVKEKGFSLLWARVFVKDSLLEGIKNSTALAYDEVRKTNPKQALKDLNLYSQLTNQDDLFVKHFTKLIEIDVPNPIPSVEHQSIEYSRIYKEQIKSGKSELYADKYAELVAEEEYHEIYCEDYAYAYDEAIKDGKSEEYADIYADKYSSELIDVKRRAYISDDEELLDFKKQKVNAYMGGWEYAFENKIENPSKFIEIYENIYLNTYNADDGMPNMSIEEINKKIVEKSLEKYLKILNLEKGL